MQTPAEEAKTAPAHSSKLRNRFLRTSSFSVALKVSHIALSLALTILLARVLGPAGYGIYSYVYALITLLAIPAMFGLPTLVVRETAQAQANAQWGLMRGVWRWATLVSAGFAAFLVVVAGTVAWLFRDTFTTVQLATFAWGLMLVPLLAFGNLRGAALRGLRKVLQGQLPESVLRPALLLGAIALALVAAPSGLTPDRAMALHVFAALVAFAAGAWLLHRYRPLALRTSPPAAQYASVQWLKSTLPLAFIAGMQLINTKTDILMLGIISTSDQVGIYRVVVQGATLVAFGLTAINLVVAPQFARLHAQGNRQALQRLVTLSARTVLLTTLAPVVLFLFWGEPLLRLVFGHAYAPGHSALGILAVGQLGNAAFGSVAYLLNMTGHERATARGVACAAAMNVVLNLALIPPFGIEGAAVATATSLVLWNVLLWHTVRRQLSIDSLAFPILRIGFRT